ncbi:hypothetical protein NE865_08341 [Phthorimaea operculella]|nr:hypothetical protein NE865_08341 [Phthorimaea operculella]
MTVKCKECGKFLSNLLPEALVCARCKGCVHKWCVESNLDAGTPWICCDCTAAYSHSQTPTPKYETKKGTDDQHGTPTPNPERFNGKEYITTLIQNLRDDLKKDFGAKLDALTEEFKAFRADMQVVRGEMAACRERVDKLEKRLDTLEGNSTGGEDGNAYKMVQALESAVTQLKLELNDRDQELLFSDVDITGIAEENGENPVHIAMTCAAKLGMKLEETDIVSCMRVGAVHKNADGTPRSRPIAVRLARQSTRDAMLKAARVRRRPTSTGANNDPKPFYVNERLTKANRALFNRARKARSVAGWKYSWTRDGKIFVRQNQGSVVYRIKSEADLERVFGPEVIGSMATTSV